MMQKMDESAKFIKERAKIKPKIAIVLGSGLSDLSESLSEAFRDRL